MSVGFVAVGTAALGAGASIYSARQQSKAADKAARAQVAATESGIAEQRRQFDAIQALLAPYAEGGEEALQAQRALIGLAGANEQQQAITQLEQSPQFQALQQQGEESILQNAAATGGLRGGNTQAALAQFRPQMLSNLIQQQYANLGGLSSLGQNAAALTGNAGQNFANQVANLYGQQGAAQAGAAIARGQANANLANNLAGSIGTLGGYFATGGKF